MKKILTLLLIILLTTTTCFSQSISTVIKNDSTVSITSEQLKYANLIFVEHKKLLIENDLLYNQIDNLNFSLDVSEEINRNRTEQVLQYQNLTSSYENQIETLNKQIKTKNKAFNGLMIGTVTVSCALILFLILK